MSNNLAGWQALGFAVEVNPDGIRQTEGFTAAGGPASADLRKTDASASASPTDSSFAAVPPIAAPTLLGMAASVTKSMAKFAASGFKTVDEDTHQVRIAQCTGCQYHSGSRCQVCGCFFDKKAWLPHEDCPLGRWPA